MGGAERQAAGAGHKKENPSPGDGKFDRQHRVIRPAVPAKDFAESKRFYSAGFKLTELGPKLVEARLGAHSLLLQDFYVEGYANNFVMHLLVGSADDWWKEIEQLALETAFRVRKPIPPKLESCGLRVL